MRMLLALWALALSVVAWIFAITGIWIVLDGPIGQDAAGFVAIGALVLTLPFFIWGLFALLSWINPDV